MVELEQRHLKGYAHFDAQLDLSKANALVNDPQAVATHQFYPFIAEVKSHQPFRNRKAGASAVIGTSKPQKKTRLLMKAARRDAAIFAAYRILLMDRYEAVLEDLELSESVIAYRHLPVVPGSASGKCNIHHAHEVIECVKKFDESVCVVLDISKYFDHIDHSLLKSSWKKVLGKTELPKDHYAVFKAITKYSCVDFEKLLFRLGLTRTIFDRKGNVKTVVQHKKLLPVWLCSLEDFRSKVAGRYNGKSRLVRVNEKTYGIPQGSPISDVLANMYLLEFDQLMKKRADSLGGVYRRYSDDIIFVVPGQLNEGRTLRSYVQSEIGKHGSQLQIKPSKTHVVAFQRNAGRLSPIDAAENERHPVGLEYLGFRFDGEAVWFRDSTVSKLRNKVRKCVKAEAYHLVRRHSSRSVATLIKEFPVGAITPKVGRIDQQIREEAQLAGKREMSFWSYAKSAQKVFGSTARCEFLNQVPYKKWIRSDVKELVPKFWRKYHK